MKNVNLRKRLSNLVLVDKSFMDEFKLLFFERLNNDEMLDELVRESNVDLEHVLYTSVDEECGQHGILILSELMKHFPTNDDNVEIGSIKMRITNNWQRNVLDVTCKIGFSFKVIFPKAIEMEDVKFNYKDKFGEECSNEIHERYTNLLRMESTFEVRAVDKLVDVTFKIMHSLLKGENN